LRKPKSKPIFWCALKKTKPGSHSGCSSSDVDAGHGVLSSPNLAPEANAPDSPVPRLKIPGAMGVLRHLRLVPVTLLLPRELMLGMGLFWVLIRVCHQRCWVLLCQCLSMMSLGLLQPLRLYKGWVLRQSYLRNLFSRF
jgi:hypothetical protein